MISAVSYAYEGANAGGLFSKGSRPVSFTYPNGRIISLAYSGTDGDTLARVNGLQEGGFSHVAYSYLGLGTFVVTDYPQPDVKLDYTAAAAGDAKYPGFDRFNRVVDHRWIGYGASPGDRDRFQYGYDRNSNRLYRANLTAQQQGKPFDELYTYDRNNRLVDFKRGTLAADKKTITGVPTRAQAWQLDATGNWPRFTSQTNGTVEVDQTRTHNQVNEITDLSVWFDPRYDAAGNMTRMPQPAAPTEGFAATYDAWNRLVKLRNMDECGCPDETVAEYEYDAQNWRTVKRTYAGGSLSETRHFYYSAAWQVLEERVNSSTNPERQFLWGPRYIDDLVLRDRDTNADGSLDERLFATQDANWNVTSIVNTSGATQERYAYDAYGTPTILDAAYSTRLASHFDWEVLFASYRFDSDTGIYYVRFRYLHSVIGAFISRDPSGHGQGTFDNYRYTRSRPSMLIDASGLEPADHQDHHVFPQGYVTNLDRKCGKEIQSKLGFNTRRFIDSFTIRYEGGWGRNEIHTWIHKYNPRGEYLPDLVRPIYDSSLTCCELVTRMAKLAADVHQDVLRRFYPETATSLVNPTFQRYRNEMVRTDLLFKFVIYQLCRPRRRRPINIGYYIEYDAWRGRNQCKPTLEQLYNPEDPDERDWGNFRRQYECDENRKHERWEMWILAGGASAAVVGISASGGTAAAPVIFASGAGAAGTGATVISFPSASAITSAAAATGGIILSSDGCKCD